MVTSKDYLTPFSLCTLPWGATITLYHITSHTLTLELELFFLSCLAFRLIQFSFNVMWVLCPQHLAWKIIPKLYFFDCEKCILNLQSKCRLFQTKKHFNFSNTIFSHVQHASFPQKINPPNLGYTY